MTYNMFLIMLIVCFSVWVGFMLGILITKYMYEKKFRKLLDDGSVYVDQKKGRETTDASQKDQGHL